MLNDYSIETFRNVLLTAAVVVFHVQEPFINHSAPCVQDKFSLYRTFVMFRTLGLRHLIVVDKSNRVVGLISRKDLIGVALERRLRQAFANASVHQPGD